MVRYLTLLLCVLASLAYSQSLVMPAHGKLEIKGNVLHYVDPSRAQSFDQVQQQVFEQIPLSESPNFGFDRSNHWFKLVLTNPTDQESFLLEVAYSVLDTVEVYVQQEGGWMKKTAGDMLPISVRDIAHRHPTFSFTLKKQESTAIYLRVHTISSVQLPLVLWHRDDFFAESYNLQMVNGLFFGAVLIMMLYQLFLFFSTRDRLALYYSIALISMANIVALFQGYDFLYIHPSYPALNDWFAMFSGPFLVVATTILTRAFLQLRSFSKFLDNLLLAIMSLNVLAAILMVIFFRQISYGVHHVFIIVHCVVELVSAAYCFYKRYRPARYYLLAWFSILTATMLFTLSNLGIIPGYFSTNYSGLMIGFVLQMLFIAFALGDRINVLEKEYTKARQLENQQLEAEVKLRTEEIQHKSERLEEVNRVKDKLFSVVSHDIKGPLSSLQLALSLLKSGRVSQEEFKKISEALEVRFSETTEFVENLLQWATLQLKGESFQPALVNLSELTQETIRLLQPEIDRKDIRLTTELQEILQVHTDLNMMRSVLRNLITNAIKFTESGGSIALRASKQDDDKIIVSVSDTGVGIPLENQGRLFSIGTISTEGTHEEKGTGLGLVLCKEFIEKSGGQIWFESAQGKGTTFYFTLPLLRRAKKLSA